MLMMMMMTIIYMHDRDDAIRDDIFRMPDFKYHFASCVYCSVASVFTQCVLGPDIMNFFGETIPYNEK